MPDHFWDATSVLLERLPVQRLNELAEDGMFEAPVSGDDLASHRDVGVCVSCEGDTILAGGLSLCCGSTVVFPGPESDDRREP